MFPINGVLVQLVRMLPCHGRGHGFEFHTHRKIFESAIILGYGVMVVTRPFGGFRIGSIPISPTKKLLRNLVISKIISIFAM